MQDFRNNPGPEDWRDSAVAVIGLAGRFPMAANVNEFWGNLCDGVDSVKRFDDEQLVSMGIEREHLAAGNHTRAGAVLEDADAFDANFFGYSASEAEVMDPQHRVFLECCWEALEDAGYDVGRYKGMIGVYAGASPNAYLLNLYLQSHLLVTEGPLQLQVANGPWSLTTRVSYKLNLRGPSYFVQTACSTSLVAVHLACQSLLAYECHMALAGGVSIVYPQGTGFCFEGGGISAPSQRCRAFDKDADGTVFGQGAGVLVLKRLEEALAAGDNIRAVIRGSALNNDGLNKVGFTAPGVDGQAAVISAALARAEVDPSTISYVEAHGTGTQIGDPIETRALLKAFGKRTSGPRSCAIGSVKTNIGHLDAAAGVAGLIKTVLAIEHARLPPSLHFRRPNPRIDFSSGPFYVNTELRAWEARPRRAGVSSFGFGGTNAHLVLEEAPARRVPDKSRTWQILLVSARTAAALDAACSNLVNHLREHPQDHLADLAYTLQTGRKSFRHRRALVCRSKEEAIKGLRESLGAPAPATQESELNLAFLFPGQGAQHLHMARGLYEQEPIFREELDRCAALCQRELGEDLKGLLFPGDDAHSAAEKLRQTKFAQPALFAVEYSLSKLWMAWGIVPSAMIGHSLGEYTAACLADVFTLEEAAHLIVRRGLLAEQAQPGRMLAVMMSEDELLRRLPDELSLAAVNAPRACVVSGATEAVEDLEGKLLGEGVGCVRLQTSRAFHSRLMQPLVPLLAEALRRVTLRPPRIPFISNVTGTWITPEQATSVDFWTAHLTDTVRFADGVRCLRERANLVCLEVGPGRTLSNFVRAGDGADPVPALFSLPHRESNEQDQQQVLAALGDLWRQGARVNWAGFYRDEKRSRLPLPTYPFERSRYRADAASGPRPPAPRRAGAARTPPGGWFYAPSWRRSERLEPAHGEQLSAQAGRWLLLVGDGEPVGLQLAELLRNAGQDVTIVCPGASFVRAGARHFYINPKTEGDFRHLLDALEESGETPDRIVHLWSVTDGADSDPLRDWEERQYKGLYSVLSIVRSLATSKTVRPRRLWVLTTGALAVLGDETLRPERATMLGPCKVLPVEDPTLTCRFMDFVPGGDAAESAARLLGEIARGGPDVIALRGDYTWEPNFEPVSLAAAKDLKPFRERGVYLITGGLGGVGFSIARHLAERSRARLILVGRTPLPERSSWEELSAPGRDDRTAKRVRRLVEIEKSGAEVLALAADVCSLEQMSAVVAEAVRRFGAINGVVHAAGIPDRGSYYEKQYEDMRSVLAPKVEGTLVLNRLLGDTRLDFFVLCSSVSSFAGVYGESVYAGANAFLDTFAHATRQRSPTPVVSVNWGAWQEVGMAAEAQVPEQFREAASRQLKKGLLPQEGALALEQILADASRRQIIVSKIAPAELLGGSALAEVTAQLPAQVGDAPSRHPRPPIESKYIPPESELERMIAGVWQDVLGIEGVGRNDGFFELGGNSLVATQLATRLRERVGKEVPVRALFGAGTVAELAQWLESSADSNLRPQPPALSPSPASRRTPPLSYEQEHLWFHHQLAPGDLAYNVPFAVRVEGPLSLSLARRALAEIIRRHDTLRCTFDDVDGLPTQLVVPGVEVAMTVIDVSELETKGRGPLIRNLIRECLGRPFDLKRGPLFRTTILRLGPDAYILLADLHHIVVDNRSALILVREFAALYAAYQEGWPSPLAELPLQYGDYASWQKQSLSGDRLQELMTYWKGRLLNLPQLRLRDENFAAEEPGREGGAEPLSIGGELLESLRGLGRKENATLFMVLLAAYVAVLHELSDQDDIVVGADVSSRSKPELDELIGFFINMLVLRTDVSGNPTFRELLGRVRESVSAAMAHRELPFGKLVQGLNPRKGRGQSPLFRAVLNYQNAPPEEPRLPGLTITAMPVESSAARFDLSLSVTERADRVEGALRYNRGAIGDELARRIKGYLVGALEAVAANPRRTVHELGLYTRGLHPDGGPEMKGGDAKPAGRFASSRRSVVVNSRQLLNSRLLYPEAGLPLVVEPAVKDVDAVSWLKTNAATAQGWLDEHGAVLFRGFAVNDPDAFRDFVTAVSPELLSYNEQAAPRVEVSPKIFTSTEYPPEYLVPLHNELSFSHDWPMKICFCCITPARRGGATPIASSSRVYELIDPRVRELLIRKKVMYVRNFGQGTDLSWQETFQTSSKAVVEEQCRRAGMCWLWREGDGLRTWRVAPPVLKHPRTGRLLWFNHAHVFHVSNNDPLTRAALLAQCEEADLPRHTFYGDGTPIEDSVLEHIREAYKSAAVRFDWQAGDVLMLDNMAVCHGRENFVGPRKILVAMSEPVEAQR